MGSSYWFLHPMKLVPMQKNQKVDLAYLFLLPKLSEKKTTSFFESHFLFTIDLKVMVMEKLNLLWLFLFFLFLLGFVFFNH